MLSPCNASSHLFAPPQDTWVKSMYPVARWVQHCGDRACEAIGHLEEAGGLFRNSFRPMASIKHPDDFDPLALEFGQAGEDCKATKFVKRTTALFRRRY